MPAHRRTDGTDGPKQTASVLFILRHRALRPVTRGRQRPDATARRLVRLVVRIPTTTGAASSVPGVFGHLDDGLHGTAVAAAAGVAGDPVAVVVVVAAPAVLRRGERPRDGLVGAV